MKKSKRIELTYMKKQPKKKYSYPQKVKTVKFPIDTDMEKLNKQWAKEAKKAKVSVNQHLQTKLCN